MKKRLGIISLFILLFIAFITVWNFSYHVGLEEGYIPIKTTRIQEYIPLEGGVFELSDHALEYSNMPIDLDHQRTLNTYYNNRAYYGAPPAITHPIKSERGIGGKACLQCHENGGFVEQFNAYAPVTPHKNLVNCRQCHVVQKSNTFFKPINLEKVHAPKVGVNNALLGTPPMIPHQLQMRENCLSCHAGPASPREIRVTHPERVNCRQCHVPTDRMVSEILPFKRTKKKEKDNE